MGLIIFSGGQEIGNYSDERREDCSGLLEVLKLSREECFSFEQSVT